MAISHVNHCFRNYLFAFYVILITLSKLQNKIEYKTCQELASFGQVKDYKQTCIDNAERFSYIFLELLI